MNYSMLQDWVTSWLAQLLLRRPPQSDPLSLVALAGALSAYLMAALLQARAAAGWKLAFGITTLDVVIMVLFSWFVLQLAGKSERFIQTLTALAGTGAVLGVLAIPLARQMAELQPGSAKIGAVSLGWLVLFAWSLAVQAHIFRHALSARFGAGVLLACLHTAIAISLLEFFFFGEG